MFLACLNIVVTTYATSDGKFITLFNIKKKLYICINNISNENKILFLSFILNINYLFSKFFPYISIVIEKISFKNGT